MNKRISQNVEQFSGMISGNSDPLMVLDETSRQIYLGTFHSKLWFIRDFWDLTIGPYIFLSLSCQFIVVQLFDIQYVANVHFAEHHTWTLTSDIKVYRSLCVGSLCLRWNIGEIPSCSQWECRSCLRRCIQSGPDPLWCSGLYTACSCLSPHHIDQCHWWWRRSGQSSPTQWTHRGK